MNDGQEGHGKEMVDLERGHIPLEALADAGEGVEALRRDALSLRPRPQAKAP